MAINILSFHFSSQILGTRKLAFSLKLNSPLPILEILITHRHTKQFLINLGEGTILAAPKLVNRLCLNWMSLITKPIPNSQRFGEDNYILYILQSFQAKIPRNAHIQRLNQIKTIGARFQPRCFFFLFSFHFLLFAFKINMLEATQCSNTIMGTCH